MSNGNIAGQIYSSGTFLAALILVFLGFIMTSFESFDQAVKFAIDPKHKKRALIALIGFISSLLTTITGMVSN